MPITITKIANPRYGTADSSLIDVDLTTDEFGVIQCSLHAADTTEYTYNGATVTNGALFTQAQSGAFGTVAAYTPPPPPAFYRCLLWQLQSVLTSAQWTSVQNWIAAQNNAALSAFFAHGTNMIPSNSQTLLQIGEQALSLTADQITTLVQQASTVSIP